MGSQRHSRRAYCNNSNDESTAVAESAKFCAKYAEQQHRRMVATAARVTRGAKGITISAQAKGGLHDFFVLAKAMYVCLLRLS